MNQKMLEQIELAEKRADQRDRRASTSVVEKAGKSAQGLLELESQDRLKRRVMAARAKEDGKGSPEKESLYESFGPVGKPTGQELTVLERVLGRNDLLDISWLSIGAECAKAVGRISLGGRGYGTGFLLSPRLLMTNHHVLDCKEAAEGASVEFDFQRNIQGNLLPSVTFQLAPDEFFHADKALDFAITAVRLDNDETEARLASFGALRIARSEASVIVGEPVTIVQHPGGREKAIVVRANDVTDIDESFLRYKADTEPGSSGSPVFDDNWSLVGLHHSGVPRRDEAGNILTRSGQPANSNTPESEIDWIANEGVRIHRILEALRELPSNPVLDEWLPKQPKVKPTAAPHPSKTLHLRKSEDTLPQSSSRLVVPDNYKEPSLEPKDPNVPMVSTTETVITIPLQIRIQIGTPSVPQVVVTGTISSPVADDRGAQPATKPPRKGGMEGALERLRAARADRRYYDQASDRGNRDNYYSGINAGQSPRELFKTLSSLVTQTHREQPRYSPAEELYPEIDLHKDGKLYSIYSKRAIDPEQAIRGDFERLRQFESMVAKLRSKESGLNSEEIAAEVALLEADLRFNCEHVVPQSWFTKREPMRGDLHHLFACEPTCNSFRGNTPFFDFSPEDEKIVGDCGRSEKTGGSNGRFEPEGGQGAVARATLYFALRYPKKFGDRGSPYDAERLSMLLRWHRDDPPGEYELHRNALIFARQGNRNPLIDFPEWSDKIDFSLGMP